MTDWKRLNPSSKRQIGRRLACSSTSPNNVVNITSVSGFSPIGAGDTESRTQGFCFERAYVIECTRPPEATREPPGRFGLRWRRTRGGRLTTGSVKASPCRVFEAETSQTLSLRRDFLLLFPLIYHSLLYDECL